MTSGVVNVAGWRLPLRLARRETRRRPGRTILVALLVAIPVMAMTFGSTWARTADADPAWDFEQRHGGADIVFFPAGAHPVRDAVPAGSSVTELWFGQYLPIAMRGDDRVVDANIIGFAGTRPDSLEVWDITPGEVPGDGEVWASDHLLDRYGLDVGDTLDLDYPGGSWTISGRGRPSVDHDADALVFGTLPVEQFQEGSLLRLTLIEVPGDAAATEAAASELDGVANAGFDGAVDTAERSAAQQYAYDGSQRRQLAWGLVAGALSLAALGIIISAAFATSARRQLVIVGQLSANGAPPRVVGRSLALQGFWTGLAGAIVGVAGGVLAAIAARPMIVDAANHDFPAMEFAPLDLLIVGLTGLLAAVIAAWFPARSAARVPTLTALAGRRPIGAVPLKLVPVGVALFGFGVLLLALATATASAGESSGDGTAAVAVLGGVMVMIGMCCCSPLAIDAMSRVAARAGGAWRFAGRSLARTRSRSAGIVTAIGVTGAITLAGSTFAVDASREDPSEPQRLPADAVIFDTWYDEGSRGAGSRPEAPVPESWRADVDTLLPGATWHERHEATYEGRIEPRSGFKRGTLRLGIDSSIVVADEAIIDFYDLPDVDREALASTGALVLNEWYEGRIDADRLERPATVDVRLRAAERPIELTAARRDYLRRPTVDENGEARYDPDNIRGPDTLMITEALARQLDLDVVTRGGFLRTDKPITLDDQERLESFRFDRFGGSRLGEVYRDAPPPNDANWNLDWEYQQRDVGVLVQVAIAAVATLLVLIVVAIGLSLAATESRDERDVLVAVGAKPVTMSRMAGVKAVVLTMTGGVLAVPTGLIPAWAVMREVTTMTFSVPWVQLAVLLLALPLVVGVAAWLTSTIAQRVRPVTMSNLAVD